MAYAAFAHCVESALYPGTRAPCEKLLTRLEEGLSLVGTPTPPPVATAEQQPAPASAALSAAASAAPETPTPTPTALAPVACTVTEPVLRIQVQPGKSSAPNPVLERGAAVSATLRDVTGKWLWVAAGELAGWAESSGLRCAQPLDEIPVVAVATVRPNRSSSGVSGSGEVPEILIPEVVIPYVSRTISRFSRFLAGNVFPKMSKMRVGRPTLLDRHWKTPRPAASRRRRQRNPA